MLKRFLPRSLFGRTILIVVLPMLLVQILSTYIFLERHWDTLSRRLVNSLANDVALLMVLHEDQANTDTAQQLLDINLRISQIEWQKIPKDIQPYGYKPLQKVLSKSLPYPVKITDAGPEDRLSIYVKTPSQILQFTAPQKRLYSITVYLYILWSLGISLVLAAIAVLFLKNQIRPIRKMAKAMIQFGKNTTVQPLKPRGSREIQLATMAFNRMQARIKSQVEERTLMLAGISHDLRTPISRMKLELSMLPYDTAANFKADLAEMERLTNTYISFVQDGRHEAQTTFDLGQLLLQAIEELPTIDQHKISYNNEQKIVFEGEEQALKRCFSNILINACRHGSRVQVSTAEKPDNIEIRITDNGPGIPKEEQYKVFQPFYSLDASHKQGAGLGLAICRDIINRHNGKILIEERVGQAGAVVVINL